MHLHVSITNIRVPVHEQNVTNTAVKNQLARLAKKKKNNSNCNKMKFTYLSIPD